MPEHPHDPADEQRQLRRALIYLAIASALWPLACISALIGRAAVNIGHGPDTGLGTKLIVLSLPLFVMAAAVFIAAVGFAWKALHTRWPLVLLLIAGLLNALAAAFNLL